MALDRYGVYMLKSGLGNSQAATEIVTLINTHLSGTLSSRTKSILNSFFGSRADATAFVTAVEASSALSATNLAKLGQALGSHKVAALIQAELEA